jgi:hypothetical protein
MKMTRCVIPIALIIIFLATDGYARTTTGDIERLTDTLTERIAYKLDASLSGVIPPRRMLAAARPVEDEPPRAPKLLSGDDIGAVISPHFGAMRACYMRYANKQREATGHVELQLSISYRGKLWALKIKAPGVSGKRYEQCMRRIARRWRFAESDKETTALFPLHYQKTSAPGAGPTRR